jgi:hypothetical protein
VDSLEVSLVLKVQVDLLEVTQEQDRVVQVVPEALVDLEASQVPQVQVDLAGGTQSQERDVPVVPEDLLDLKANLELFRVLEVQVGLAEGTQLQDREVQVVPEVLVDLQADRVEVTLVQDREDQLVLENSRVPATLEVQVAGSQVRGHQVDHPVHRYQTHSSHLVQELDQLSQTESTYRPTTDNGLTTTAHGSYLNVNKFLRSVFTNLYFCYVLINRVQC